MGLSSCLCCPACIRCLAQGAGLRVWGQPKQHSSLRAQVTPTGLALPLVCGKLGAGLPQLLPPVHTVYLAGWLPAHPEEVTGTSEELLQLPRFGIVASQAGERQKRGVAAGPRCLHGGRGWGCSLVGAVGTQRGSPVWAAAWSPPGKGHWQRLAFPKIKRGETQTR